MTEFEKQRDEMLNILRHSSEPIATWTMKAICYLDRDDLDIDFVMETIEILSQIFTLKYEQVRNA